MTYSQRIWTVALCAAIAWSGMVWSDLRSLTSISPESSITALSASLDEVMETAMERYSISGAVAGAIRNGEVIWRARHGQSQANGRPVTGETSFNIASISKPLTVWIVMVLAEAGAIDLDAPINDYLTRWTLTSDAFDPGEVTVRRVLQHSAGLNIHGFGGYGPGEAIPGDIPELMASGYEVKLVSKPGARWRYSGGGYILLQMMVEDVTGGPFDRAAERLLFKPLGMKSSAFNRERLSDHSAAFAHNGNEIPSLVDVALAAAGGWSSAEDMERFLVAHIDGGDVLSEQGMTELASPSETSQAHGMSYTRRSTPEGVMLGHGGNNSTWHGQIYVRPTTGDGFYFLTNTTTGAQLDIDLSCAWLSWATGDSAAAACTDELGLTRKLSVFAATAGIILIVLVAQLSDKLASGRRRLSLIPTRAGWFGFLVRILGALVCLLFAVTAIVTFWFDWIYWRSDVIFIDEIPLRELEWALPIVPAVFGVLALTLWSSPAPEDAQANTELERAV